MIFSKKLSPRSKSRRILVSTKSYRRYWTQSLESIHSDLFAFVDRWVERGSTVWDVGANCGVFTFAAAVAAGATGKVVAVEADLQCAALIDRSRAAKVDDEAPVVICPFAVSAASGTVKFEISNYRSAANSISGFGRFDAGGVQLEVPVFTLDSLAMWLPAPKVMKIDVEGAELLVLSGAFEVLRQHRPVIALECTGGETGLKIEALLRKLDYAWRPLDASDSTMFTQQSIMCSDIVALPVEDPRCQMEFSNLLSGVIL